MVIVSLKVPEDALSLYVIYPLCLPSCDTLVKYMCYVLASVNLSSGGNLTLMRLPAGAGLSKTILRLTSVKVDTSGLSKVISKLLAGTLAYKVGEKPLSSLNSIT